MSVESTQESQVDNLSDIEKQILVQLKDAPDGVLSHTEVPAPCSEKQVYMIMQNLAERGLAHDFIDRSEFGRTELGFEIARDIRKRR